VWPRSFVATAAGLRSDVGVGVRYRTPIGLIRGDVALQLNPIPGLADGTTSAARTWRLHVSVGQAF